MHPVVKQYAEDLMEDHPPMLGEGFFEPGSPEWLKVRLAYQRWLAQKLTGVFSGLTPLEAVEIIAPMLD